MTFHHDAMLVETLTEWNGKLGAGCGGGVDPDKWPAKEEDIVRCCTLSEDSMAGPKELSHSTVAGSEIVLVLTPKVQFSSEVLLITARDSEFSGTWPDADSGAWKGGEISSSVVVGSTSDCLLVLGGFDGTDSLFSRCFCRAPTLELVF